ncbi:uncharacterized protein LOC116308174 [Actinia tenebrosa]|uniref:Uncharacterized protein LOC116308174 n=1 Tax=Actinia tenebrosa TaxID=6105 RepID=A0A6P8J362_ACTTE|nr:uncharacterized protein LOC116308174 [Actinia tenebrosa]
MKQKSQILNVLGFTYRERYELDLAEAYMSMCVEVTKQAYGDIHEEVVERLCNYGIILHDLWQNERAIQVLKEARRMAESLGSDLPICAQVYNYTAKVFLRWFLGLIYTEGMTEKAINYLNKSKNLHEKALQIYENLQGKEHKFYAGTLMTYSMVLRHQGEIETAFQHCEEAVSIYRSSGHIAWPRALTWLADICFARKEFDVAKRYLEQAIKGDNEFGTTIISPGAFHPQALLAEALLKTGPKENGIRILKECIDEWKKKGMHPQHYWIVRAQSAISDYENRA